MESRRTSYEILADLMKRLSAKYFAYQMRVSLSLVYKWSANPEQAEELGSVDARNNPLDRVQEIIRMAVINGYHDLAIEIMNWLAREFGGAYVSGTTVAAIKRVAELASAYASEHDIAALKCVAESDQDNGQNGHNIARCQFCGFKYVPHDRWRPLSEACDQCYDRIQAGLGREYELRKRL